MIISRAYSALQDFQKILVTHKSISANSSSNVLRVLRVLRVLWVLWVLWVPSK